MERGIVISQYFEFRNTIDPKEFMRGREADLRKYLLFWDRIDSPVNNKIVMPGGGDIDFLVSAGIAKRTVIGQNLPVGGPLIELVAATQWEACKLNSRDSAQEWSVERPTEELQLPTDQTITRACLEFELYDALCIPTGEVALEDVLEFKSRRMPELWALRDAMDDIIATVNRELSLPKAKNTAVDRLERRISEFNTVMSETSFQTVMRSLRSVSSTPWLGVVAISTGMFPEQVTPFVSHMTAAAVGASLLSLAIKGMTVGRELPSELKPFAYLASASRELR